MGRGSSEDENSAVLMLGSQRKSKKFNIISFDNLKVDSHININGNESH